MNASVQQKKIEEHLNGVANVPEVFERLAA